MALKELPITETFTLPPFPKKSALLQAQHEIRKLSSRLDLMPIMIFGTGQLTPEEIEENKRRKIELRNLRLAIIAKHGVEEEFLTPLLEEIAKLETRLEYLREGVVALVRIRDTCSS